MSNPRAILIASLILLGPTSILAADAPSPGGLDPVPAATPLATQPLDRLSVTRERPLFSPTRRPPPPPPAVAEAPAPAPPPPPDVALFGIVMDGARARAVIRANPAAKVTRVEIGDDVGGWKVAQIEGRKLVLALDGRLATFVMFTGNNPNAAPRPDAMPQAVGNPSEQIRQSSANAPQVAPAQATQPKPHKARQLN
jgi:hypothetical protein